MKPSLPVLLAILATAGAARADEVPAFKSVRADEDYSYLRNAADRAGLDRLRYIPLGYTAYLGLGGEARLRVDAGSAPRFGIGNETADTFALGRLLLSGDLHLAPAVRVYGELGLHRDLGKRAAPAPTDRDSVDAQVLFVDLTPAPGWRLRLGRQELQLNPTQRFVAVREGPNVRQSFDGARVTRTIRNLKLDAFHLQPVVLSPGAFDDTRNRNQRFYGLYVATRLSPHDNLDAYVMGLERDGARFGAITGDERRISLGARLAGSRGPIDYEAEGVAQDGRFAGRQIRAFAASAGGGYTLDHHWKPRLGLRLDLGSGDSDPTDQRLETFNPMFPKGAYFNETGLTSWGNLTALRASLGLAPARTVALEASYTAHRCQTRADAIYLQPLTALAPTCGDRSKSLGGAAQLDGTWQVNRNLKIQAQLVHRTAGETLRGLGGRRANLAVLFAQFRF
ncbi:alginate export family protein [Caulobacter vibrioides]|uniref:Alginate export family protein n=1 Tax=Caulobacter vibrioides TaxID=155892 RepID=A0A290MXQ4_CAUVI|nr:alginate export family protein [Caulobacter vibrioides]ATC32010.1 alginate export family protein [Caulobacter vibrioides]